MGRNLVLNIADHGFKVCGYDRSEEQTKRMNEEAGIGPLLQYPHRSI
ncbi:NAD(P)-binding domain-containing protein [Niabella sp. W65]|nr:NAD(P)-binding domain-containing protein [Niabella sp. W65]MCH7368316.1 NAD(P)-binding domain-containing protein [Niabella sp. W65]